MCLSTVYKNTVTPETVAMKNVMKIECQGDMVILTDLMERQMAIHGELVMANLVEGAHAVDARCAQRLQHHFDQLLHGSSLPPSTHSPHKNSSASSKTIMSARRTRK